MKVDIVVGSVVVVVVVVQVEARFIEGYSGPLAKNNILRPHTAGLAGGSENHFT